MCVHFVPPLPTYSVEGYVIQYKESKIGVGVGASVDFRD